jgi:hypothetical protein
MFIDCWESSGIKRMIFRKFNDEVIKKKFSMPVFFDALERELENAIKKGYCESSRVQVIFPVTRQ